MTDASPDTPHYLGHRQRLRERLVRSGGEDMQDYELLELLLCLAVPRRDMKPLAKELLKKFGSYAEVISADPARLTEVKGMGDTTIAALKLTQASVQRFTLDTVLKRPVLANWRALLDHCKANMAFLSKEQFRVLFLNQRNILIADEVLARGTVDHTPAYPRDVVKRAVELNAISVIISHNHPSGDPTPSPDDIKMTKMIVRACAELGITVHDHLVLAKSGHASFRSLGLFEGMQET